MHNVSVQGQCVKNYLCGDDLDIEHTLQCFEDRYVRDLRVLSDETTNLAEQDLYALREFAMLQHSRTEAAINMTASMWQDTYDAVFEGYPPALRPELDVSTRAMILESFKTYTSIRDSVTDLKICIVKNEVPSDFIASDDPVVLTNMFHAQKLKKKIFGLDSAGVLLFLPLSPRLFLVCYDGDAYAWVDKHGGFASINKDEDVRACNELQYLKAAKNIYFSNWDQKDKIGREFKKVTSRRRGPRLQISKVGYYTFVSPLHRFPSTWMSKLRFRNKIKCKYNGSAVGYVRERAWQSRISRSGP